MDGTRPGRRRRPGHWILAAFFVSVIFGLQAAPVTAAGQADDGTPLGLDLMAKIDEWINPPVDDKPLSAKEMVALIRSTEQSQFTGANSVISILEKSRQREIAELEEWKNRPAGTLRPGPWRVRIQERKIASYEALLDCLEYQERCDGIYRIEKQREQWKRTGDPLPQDPSIPTDAETLQMLESSLARYRAELELLRAAVDSLLEAVADSALDRAGASLGGAQTEVGSLIEQTGDLLGAMKRLAMDGTLLCDSVADLVQDATRTLDRAVELQRQLSGQLAAVRSLAEACASASDALRLENLASDARASATELEAMLHEAEAARQSAQNKLDEWTRALGNQPDRARGDQLYDRSQKLLDTTWKEFQAAKSALERLEPIKAEAVERLNRYSATDLADEQAAWERIYADDSVELQKVTAAFGELGRPFEEAARQGRAGVDWAATLEKEAETHLKNGGRLQQLNLEVAMNGDSISLFVYPECSLPRDLVNRLAEFRSGFGDLSQTLPSQQWVADTVTRCRAAAGGGGTLQPTPVPPRSTEVQKASFDPRDYVVSEGGRSVQVVVRRLGGTSGEFKVDFATVDAYAEAGKDYSPVSRTLTWGPDPNTPTDKTITIPILDDSEVEREETIHLELRNPRNDMVQVTIDEGWEATVRIADNDSSPVEPQPSPQRECEVLTVTADLSLVRPGGTARLTVEAVFSDGSREDVTNSPLLVWRKGPGSTITAPVQMRFSERVEAEAEFAGECVGRATVLLEPPSYSEPISDDDDRGAVVPPPPSDAFDWRVVCRTGADACSVTFTQQVDFSRHVVLSEALPGPRGAEQWIDSNCPSGRCARDGTCAADPVRGGEWAVLCNTVNGEVTLSRDWPSDPSRKILEGDFCGEPDARWWVEDNCPGWRCDTSGQCASGPIRESPADDGWYVVCYLLSGDVEIGKGPFDPATQTQLGGPFLGEPDARDWANQNYPTWLCDASSGGTTRPYGLESLPAEAFEGAGGGFAERGQSVEKSERQSDFVGVGSEEALEILSDAQRAYFESQVKGRGFSGQSLRQLSEEIARNVRKHRGEPEPNLLASEAFKALVDVAIWQITGEKPPGLGGGTGTTSGGGAGGMAGGGSGSGGEGPKQFKVLRCAKREQAWGSTPVETFWCFCLGPGQAQPAGWDRCEQVPGLLAEYDCKVKANRCIDELPRTVILE